MNILQICPSHLSDVATLPWEIQKSYFSIIFQHCYSYTSDYLRWLRRKGVATVVLPLAVYLLLFSASYYLHSHSTAS